MSDRNEQLEWVTAVINQNLPQQIFECVTACIFQWAQETLSSSQFTQKNASTRDQRPNSRGTSQLYTDTHCAKEQAIRWWVVFLHNAKSTIWFIYPRAPCKSKWAELLNFLQACFSSVHFGPQKIISTVEFSSFQFAGGDKATIHFLWQQNQTSGQFTSLLVKK